MLRAIANRESPPRPFIRGASYEVSSDQEVAENYDAAESYLSRS